MYDLRKLSQYRCTQWRQRRPVSTSKTCMHVQIRQRIMMMIIITRMIIADNHGKWVLSALNQNIIQIYLAAWATHLKTLAGVPLAAKWQLTKHRDTWPSENEIPTPPLFPKINRLNDQCKHCSKTNSTVKMTDMVLQHSLCINKGKKEFCELFFWS